MLMNVCLFYVVFDRLKNRNVVIFESEFFCADFLIEINM